MATKKKPQNDGEFKIIHCAKNNDKKVVTDKTLELFKSNSPDAGDYELLEGSYATAEEAETAIKES